MTKTLVLVLIILVVGFLIIKGCIWLYKEAERAEDEDHQERRETERALREARDDFRYEQTMADRFAEKKGKKK